MKVYVQCDKNMIPKDYDHFNAYSGFYEMGFETVFFNTYDQLKESAREDVVIGYIGTVNRRLSDFGVAIENLDYPESIRKYLGRQIWISKVDTINSNPELWPVFIKPVANKKFVGRVVRTTADLIGCGR